jgi:hypothetical protein
VKLFAGPRRIVFIITILIVGIPAGEWLSVRGDALDAATIPPLSEEGRPSRTSKDLKRLWDLSRIGDSKASSRPKRPSRGDRNPAPHLKDPFAANSYLPPPVPTRLQPLEPPLPQLRLIGLAGGRDHHVAMLTLDGVLVTLAVGESSGEVRLERVAPPDGVTVVVRGKTIELRVL